MSITDVFRILMEIVLGDAAKQAKNAALEGTSS